MLLAGITKQNQHVMVCSCGHGGDDCWWHVPFALWVYGHGLRSLGHNLHTGIHPFHTSEYPAEELDVGDFGRKNHQAEPTRDGV